MQLSLADERFLVLAPTGRDAVLTCTLLSKNGLDCQVCHSIEELCERVREEGVATLLLAEETLTRSALSQLQGMLNQQGSWSDLPILVFTGENGLARSRAATTLGALGNVTFLDRPVRPVTMVSAARAALRARHRQYAARAELIRQDRALRVRDEFLAMLGHELRNPLSAIAMAITAMGESDAREVRILRRQSEHLTRLVDDLLDVSRVTTGKAVLQTRTLDLVELVSGCLQALQGSARDHGLALALDAPSSPILVDGDPVRLEQAVANLVTNAVKYTPRGGHIDVRVEAVAGEALVRIQDDGVGIDGEMLGRVFELFAQAEGSLARASGGMGIGLTLVRSLVEQHGGRVEAASPGLGKGSTFTIRLPICEGAVVSIESASPPSLHAGADRGRDVLVIEDNADSREMLVSLLERDGYQVYEAGDGPEGIEQAIARRPRALLIDIGLPGVDGYQVAKTIRAALGADVFMVALTGYGQPDDKARALAAGFDVHFTKPVDLKAIKLLLNQVEARPLAQ
ncbi:MAG: response regulator [Polyangiaceae bacterium]|nr:response regulator [Polyangiaceae bacterium]